MFGYILSQTYVDKLLESNPIVFQHVLNNEKGRTQIHISQFKKYKVSCFKCLHAIGSESVHDIFLREMGGIRAGYQALKSDFFTVSTVPKLPDLAFAFELVNGNHTYYLFAQLFCKPVHKTTRAKMEKEIGTYLDKMHANGFAHNDICPEHIMTYHGSLKLADFGFTFRSSPERDLEDWMLTIRFLSDPSLYLVK